MLDPESHANVEIDSIDTITQSILVGMGKHLFQPSTHYTQIVCEQVTSAKKAIHVKNKSKLCHTARMITSLTGDQITCPSSNHPWTANIPLML